MTALLVALLLVLLLPLFVGKWQVSVLGLAAQGLLMGWLACRWPHGAGEVSWLTIVDLLVVRGVVLPIALWRVLRARATTAGRDGLPPNLLTWAGAVVLLLAAFGGADVLAPTPALLHLQVAVAISGLLLGFLVLATQGGVFAQVVGVVRIGNAVALLQLGSGHADWRLALAHLAVVGGTLVALVHALVVVREVPSATSAGRESPV